MHRLRTVTYLDVSAVAGHHAMPAALLFFKIHLPSFFFFFLAGGGGGGVGYMPQMHTDRRHIIIISEGCIGCIMNCASTILTTHRTMET